MTQQDRPKVYTEPEGSEYKVTCSCGYSDKAETWTQADVKGGAHLHTAHPNFRRR